VNTIVFDTLTVVICYEGERRGQKGGRDRGEGRGVKAVRGGGGGGRRKGGVGTKECERGRGHKWGEIRRERERME
jgi:hypothetical protein